MDVRHLRHVICKHYVYENDKKKVNCVLVLTQKRECNVCSIFVGFLGYENSKFFK